VTEAFSTDFATGRIWSRNNSKRVPYIYLSKMGRSQVFEHVNLSSSKAIGINKNILSGPIAITAAPMHSSTCR